MSRYNAKYEVDCRRGLEDEDIEDVLEKLDQFGPYACLDWDSYHNGVYVFWAFSDPDFVIEGCEDQPWTLEGELYKYGNQHYLAIAHTIKTLRTFYVTDDEIYDFFVDQGEEWFGDAAADALMTTCCNHICTKFFEMPTSEAWD